MMCKPDSLLIDKVLPDKPLEVLDSPLLTSFGVHLTIVLEFNEPSTSNVIYLPHLLELGHPSPLEAAKLLLPLVPRLPEACSLRRNPHRPA